MFVEIDVTDIVFMERMSQIYSVCGENVTDIVFMERMSQIYSVCGDRCYRYVVFGEIDVTDI